MLPLTVPRALRALPLACGLLLGLPAGAQTTTAPAKATKPPAKAAKPTPKPATPRQQLKREAEGLALATQTVEAISQAQLDIAARVLTGTADCEFNQHITVEAVAGVPGHFNVGHKGQRFTMVPEETVTGAVRLQDKRAGIVWLQIPTKSMLMNSKLGQRMVDSCQHAEQRLAVNATAASIGIAPAATAAEPGAAAASMPR